jgi:selenocysteine lyase/cysteine desulfurase
MPKGIRVRVYPPLESAVRKLSELTEYEVSSVRNFALALGLLQLLRWLKEEGSITLTEQEFHSLLAEAERLLAEMESKRVVAHA